MNINKKLLLLLILFISVGFAFLTANLTINGNISFIKGNFDVHFDNAEIIHNNSYDGNIIINEGNKTTITSLLSLEKPGDYAEYSFYVVNAGTIDASLDTLTISGLTSEQKEFFTTSIIYAYDGKSVAINDYLRAGQSKKIIVRVTYNFDVSTLTNDATLNLQVTMKYINPKKLSTQTIWDYEYTGTEQIFYVNKSGKYKLEVWGAQGGGYDQYYGGYGAYAVGEATFATNQKLFVNIGGTGLDGYVKETIYSGGYNGGGNAHRAPSDKKGIGTGGGATHIALSTGLLSTFENKLEELLIVAGGGGAGAYPYFGETNYYYAYGGHGGGITGGSSTGYSGFISPTSWHPCMGGGQTMASSRMGGETSQISSLGTFGQGGFYTTDGHNYSSSGGGGGFYGGDGCRNFGGGGGSSYLGNNLLNNKSIYCYDCEISDDVDTKTISISKVSKEALSQTAKQGNGHARITYIGK